MIKIEEDSKIKSVIVLRAIMSKQRMNILKSLHERRKTATELSRDLHKHKTTITNHLLKLQLANLVEKDEAAGSSYKYYSLTNKGQKIFSTLENIIEISSLFIITALSVALYGLIYAFDLSQTLKGPAGDLNSIYYVYIVCVLLATALTILSFCKCRHAKARPFENKH